MPAYTFRCPTHGDFELEQPMAETTPYAYCPQIGHVALVRERCPKVLGASMQFTYGRDVFHDGPNLDGHTVRETADRWVTDAKARGLDPVHVGNRWV